MRLPELSRRAVMGGTSLIALAPKHAAAAPAASDETVRWCARWLSLDARIARLQTRWGQLETWLAREHRWFSLTPEQQQALPWARELHDIDGCLDTLFEQRAALMERVPPAGAPDLSSIIARLAVAERLTWQEDHPEAHALIVGSLLDLRAMFQQG
ncbi:helicase [Phenylobacterium soli]|uniref:helicase n=1 Tax=Phenylobacterium soli TaxID=2170551 RepID=UPI001D04B4E0|nr:helicase [Phenylobacterium soli]